MNLYPFATLGRVTVFLKQLGQHPLIMKKLFITVFLVTTFAICGMGFANPEGVALLANTHWMSAFYVVVFSGLASVGLIDLFNQDEGVSLH